MSEGADGSRRAVSEFDVKNGDVPAVQFAAVESVTPVLLQQRHPAADTRPPGLFRTEPTPHNRRNYGRGGRGEEHGSTGPSAARYSGVGLVTSRRLSSRDWQRDVNKRLRRADVTTSSFQRPAGLLSLRGVSLCPRKGISLVSVKGFSKNLI